LPEIVRAVYHQVPGVDQFSINRLIYSDNASASQAMVSWREAADAINEAAKLIRRYGYALCFWPVPLCVFRGGNARFVDAQVRRHVAHPGVRFALRYLDPLVASGAIVATASPGAALAAPKVCQECHYRPVCGGIEQEYHDRFGAEGLGFASRAPA
jgi:hypothetical protein